MGYRAANSSEFRRLVWRPAQEPGAKKIDGAWGCADSSQPYPAMLHTLVHPCASPHGNPCCGLKYAAFDLRFQSFVTAPQGMLLMAYEVRRSPVVPEKICMELREQTLRFWADASLSRSHGCWHSLCRCSLLQACAVAA